MSRIGGLRWWAVAAIALLLSAGAAAADPLDHPAVPDQVIIKFKANATQADKDRILSDLGATRIKTFKRVKAEQDHVSGVSVADAIGRYRNHPAVEYIEPNYILNAEEIPNDPQFGQLWGMRNTGQTGGTPGADISAENAWDVFTGSPNVVIGVIDTGVDYNHPDLAANIWTNPGEIAGNGIDDDANGFIDDVHGYDFINTDGDPMDDNGHGTHVSGTIGAVGNNGVGVAGVNWTVKVMALKFLSAGGSGSLADAVEAIEYATMMGLRGVPIRLTSNSWGGGGFSETMRQAIADAGAAGILFVAAAGNSSSNNDTSPHYPSSYTEANVVAVAATDHNDALASFSSYGATSVDLAAPGVDILSTLPGGAYGQLSGTSMATPHVSGALGLVFGRFPAIAAANAKALILNFADPVPGLTGRVLTGGRLNAFFPIAEPDTIPPGAVNNLASSQVGSNWVELAWTATGDDGGTGTASRYDMRYSTSPIDAGNFGSATPAEGEPDPSAAGSPEQMRVNGLAFSTGYFFAVRALDEFGNAGPISNVAGATTLGAPDIAVAPTSLSEALLTGGTSTQQLTLSNVAEGTLDFTVPLPVLLGNPATVHVAQEFGKDEPDTRTGGPVIAGSGGPDGFGYRWNDSDDPFGPTFAWQDISGTGSVALSTGDDASAGPFPIGFNFSYYGGEFTQFWVSSNGAISLSSSASPYSNQPLPSPGAPPHLIAPFWDDLLLGGGGTVYWRSDGSRLIVQYNTVAHYSAGGPYTFQAILNNDGTIDFQYLTMGTPVNSATVGIQNGTGTDGLTVAFNSDYLHDNLAIRFRAIPQWVTVTPTAGTVWAPGSTTLDVHFNAADLLGGTYDGVIRILSNDPDEPEVNVPVQLVVTGAPDIAVEPAAFDFGNVFLGLAPTTTVLVRNPGTDVLNVTGITTTDGAFTVAPAAFAVPAKGAQAVTVTFTPTVAQAYAAQMNVASDDPDEPTVSVNLAGTGQEPPQFAYNPTSLASNLLTGGSESQTVTFTNNGGSNFNFSLNVQLDANVTVVNDDTELGKDEVDVRAGDPVTEGHGGPDTFGYSWIDSDEPGGPVFNWVDISGTGTPVFAGTADDVNVGPFPIGFTFPFYGNDFTTFRVCSNGFISFTSNRTNLTNTALPNSGSTIPENLLAVFWDDLRFDAPTASNLYYKYDGTKLIVQYNNVPRYSTTFRYTFQVLLYPNGNIVYQYLTMNGTRLNEATIGMQNQAKNDGLQVVYNANYVHNNLAIRFSAAPEWLTVTPTSGSIPPGGSLPVVAFFDASGMFGGTYTGRIQVNSNDPSVPHVDIPATLHVTGAPDIQLSTTSIDFGPVFVGYPSLRNMVISNVGTDNLVISDVQIPDAAFATDIVPPVTLAPLGQLLVNVRFGPTAVGPHSSAITLVSNDPDSPSVAFAVAGVGIDPPIASVAPTTLASNLFTGQQEVQSVLLTNSGGSDLTYTVSTQTAASEVVVGEYTELAKDEADPRIGNPVLDGTGGPDLFGYRWVDSDEPGGPVFNWVDISAVGTPVFTTRTDDGNSGPFPIGFTFPYYENSFTTFRICSNGWISFTSTRTVYNNQLLPITGTGAAENMIAPFWEDLVVDPSLGNNVYYYNDGTRLIVQWNNVPRLTSGGPYTFQVQLYPNGAIVYQYLSMQGTRLNEATIGQQNATQTDGLTIVFNNTYVHDNLAIRTATVPPWLGASPVTGVVPAGGSVPISVTFDAAGMFGGDYAGSIDIVTNDPAHGLLNVLANLHVTGVPDLAWSPAMVAFGNVYLGYSGQQTLMVSNAGTDLLTVTGITAGLTDYTVSPTAFNLQPLQSQAVTVTFQPTVPGDRATQLTITSNDADSPQTVEVTGTGVIPPDITTSPATVVGAAPVGGSKTKTLTICNEGGSNLNFSVAAAENAQAVVQSHDYVELGKEEADTRPGILGTGGPDAFGYTWSDSDEPNGPAFNWVDISGVGTPAFGAYSDDGNRGPFPIGFSFPFYGQNFTDFRICSNGWISFTSSQATYTNQALPNSGSTVPENLLAAFWDDNVVDPTDGNEVWYHNDGTKLIVQYNVRRIAQASPPYHNFEILLYPNGEIVYQYLAMGPTIDSATIGIQNATKDDGLTVAFNAAYVHPNLAVRFRFRPAWLTVAPTSGTIAPGECAQLQVVMSAAELEAGDYTGTIVVDSNDPDEPSVTTNVVFHVGSVDAVATDIDPNTLNAESNGRYITGRVELPPEYDPCDVVLSTVTVNGVVPALEQSYSCTSDYNNNGIPDLQFKFDRAAVEAVLPDGDNIEIAITGEIEDTIWFRATDMIRVIRPHLATLNGGEHLVAGEPVSVQWANPDGWAVASADLHWSSDDGVTWQTIATGIQGTSYSWEGPGTLTDAGRVRVLVYDTAGIMGYDVSDAAFSVTAQSTGVDQPAVPRTFALVQNVPNPFNPQTVIGFDLPHAARVVLKVFDAMGREVNTLVAEALPAGSHRVIWRGDDRDGNPVASGVYTYQIQAGDFQAVKRMVVIK